MSNFALQQDLFSTEPDLPIARLSENNHRCLRDEDCHWERHIMDQYMSWSIGIGRTETGYFSTFNYNYGAGGVFGPVFIRSTPAPDFQTARQKAIAGLLLRLQTVYDKQSRPAQQRLIAHIERTIF